MKSFYGSEDSYNFNKIDEDVMHNHKRDLEKLLLETTENNDLLFKIKDIANIIVCISLCILTYYNIYLIIITILFSITCLIIFIDRFIYKRINSIENNYIYYMKYTDEEIALYRRDGYLSYEPLKVFKNKISNIGENNEHIYTYLFVAHKKYIKSIELKKKNMKESNNVIKTLLSK